VEESCLTDDAVLDFVNGYAGGRLDEPARAAVERHLGGCELCSRLVAVAAAYPEASPANDVAPTSVETVPSRGAPSPERTSSLPLGTRLRETYTLVRLVGRGGMGEVYEATHARLPGRYAVKVLHPHCVADPKALVRFRREADITSELRHPNIVSIIDFDYTPGGAPYLVMEFLDGDELAHVILEGAPMPIERVLATVDQVASALTAVHRRGIVHRDLKPQNIFLVRDPNADDVGPTGQSGEDGAPVEQVKLVDFGISKVRAASMVLTGERVLLGTPQYMAPEQARGTGNVDARADQFALASIVYEMLTGRLAFPGDRVEVVVYRITHEEPRPLGAPWGPAIARVLDRAMAKAPDARYPSVADFATALRAAAVADRPVSGKGFQAQTTMRNLPQSPPAATEAFAPETPTTIRPVSVTGADTRRPNRVGAVAVVLAIAAVTIVVATRRRSPSEATPVATPAAATAAPPALPPPRETPRPIEAAPVKPAAEKAPVEHVRAAGEPRAAKKDPTKSAGSVRDSKLGSLIDRL
jgi:serine/threonine protein kinase